MENLKVRDHTGDLDVHCRIILKSILKIKVVRVWTKFSWLRVGLSSRFLGT
jgi:hypothetical protein